MKTSNHTTRRLTTLLGCCAIAIATAFATADAQTRAPTLDDLLSKPIPEDPLLACHKREADAARRQRGHDLAVEEPRLADVRLPAHDHDDVSVRLAHAL